MFYLSFVAFQFLTLCLGRFQKDSNLFFSFSSWTRNHAYLEVSCSIQSIASLLYYLPLYVSSEHSSQAKRTNSVCFFFFFFFFFFFWNKCFNSLQLVEEKFFLHARYLRRCLFVTLCMLHVLCTVTRSFNEFQAMSFVYKNYFLVAIEDYTLRTANQKD